MAPDNSPEVKALHQPMLDFIAAFMRSLNNARLYASGHELVKKNVQDLYEKFEIAIGDRNFLFIGCAKDNLFLEGDFYTARDSHFKTFLTYFHSMRISNLFLDKEVTPEEVEAFVGLLAGANQGQGDEVSEAFPQENIKRIKIGLLDYSIFSSVQSVASELAHSVADESIWRQLIVQPAAAGTFNLDPEGLKELNKLSQDVDELKKLLVKLDTDMKSGNQAATTAQRGVLLGNFIQNLGKTLEGLDAEERRQFSLRLGGVLDSLEPQLKTQILGSVVPPEAGEEETGVIHEIIQAMPDTQLVNLLADALVEAGPKSACFDNLLNRAIAKYKDPGLLLTLIRSEMNRATQERRPDHLNHWQQLEQLLLQQQEAEELNQQYRKEIDALAASIQMEKPLVEEDEIDRLSKSLEPEPLRAAKVRLIVDLIRNPHPTKASLFVPPLLENLGEGMNQFLGLENYVAVASLLRAASLSLSNLPQDHPAWQTMNTLLSTRQVGELVQNLIKKCSTFKPEETAGIDAVCQLYPEKAGGVLVDALMELEAVGSPQGVWLSTTLASFCNRLGGVLGRKLQEAPELALPQLLDLAIMSGDSRLGTTVDQLLEHPNHDIRLKVVETLGSLKADKSVPRLAEVLLQKGWLKGKKLKTLQMATAQTLVKIGTDQALETLKKAAEEGSGELKSFCQKAVTS